MKYINKPRLLFLVLVLTLLLALSISYAKSVSNDIANSVFRLHIIANSNSAADQNLKLSVRDRILKDASFLFDDLASAEDACEIANEKLTQICQIAEDEIASQGFDYKVCAEVGEFAFPTKTYGDISLPSGKYNALRIKIGNSQGENWWCVMYPPLCLADGILACPKDSKAKLKNELSPEEYRLVTKESSGVIPVQVRFKIVEIFQNLF